MARPIIRTLWMAWEAVFRLFARVHPLVEDESHLFLVAKRRYLGRPFTVDGIRVKRFERVIELHFNNEMVLDFLQGEHKSLVGTTVKLLREGKRSMPILANRVSTREFDDQEVLYGVTFIHRGVEQFGFHVIPLRSKWIEKMTAWHLRNLFRVINPNAATLLATHPGAFVPKLVAISKRHLVELYTNRESTRSTQGQLPDHVTV